jgi:hypothetical protein
MNNFNIELNEHVELKNKMSKINKSLSGFKMIWI